MAIFRRIWDKLTGIGQELKLKQKFVLIYFIGIVVPVILVESTVLYSINSYQKRVQKVELGNSVDKVLNEFSSIMEQMMYFSRNAIEDKELVSILDNEYKSPAEYLQTLEKDEPRSVLNYYKFIKEISNVTIYVDNNTIVDTDHIKQLNEITKTAWWYQQFSRSESNYYVFEDITKKFGSGINPKAGTICCIRRFQNMQERECILVLELDYNQIHHILLEGQTQCDIYISNGERILFASDTSVFKSRKDKIPVVHKIEKESNIIKKMVPSVTEDWRVYGVSNKKPILTTLFSSKELFFFIIFLNLLLPTIIINAFITSTIRRLHILDSYFDGLRNEQFDKIPYDRSKDEISQLFLHYNSTVDTIQKLIQTIIIKNDEKHALEATKKQAELNALNTQVNPHFLYNTLECICMRSMIKGESETAEVVRCLSVLMRQMSKWDKDIVTIEEELFFVEKYLIIQKYRFADKLTYEVKLEEKIKSYRIPKLTIVSFVENACVHGVEESINNGDISVVANVDEDTIHILVRDTGCGMDETVLDKLKNTIDTADVNTLYHAKSTGILNAALRLKMYFGERLSFSIQSEVNKGTSIDIVILKENDKGM